MQQPTRRPFFHSVENQSQPAWNHHRKAPERLPYLMNPAVKCVNVEEPYHSDTFDTSFIFCFV
ncbi:hypothetical protein DSLASN_19130 [Desulfoluna limicola]|uniref:Uncharacterized protein n=1 Tax=Desulfoluna limicola TaxID=2810562 RepID=A0ABM7PG24_9BACT|nr:hypothetical protein DSLASN_19130 [Desulfoluna limicola]